MGQMIWMETSKYNLPKDRAKVLLLMRRGGKIENELIFNCGRYIEDEKVFISMEADTLHYPEYWCYPNNPETGKLIIEE